MKTFALAAFLFLVACDAAVTPVDACSKTDPQLIELAKAKRTWGETWCPVTMQIELREVDEQGNALCVYEAECGTKYQIFGCSPSYGIRCVAWKTAANETDRLTDLVGATKGN